MSERESEGNRAYMEGQQQLFVAAKVNRLCEAAYSKELDIDTYVSYAQDIVGALDSRLKPDPSYGIKLIRRIGGKRKSFVAATEHGNVSASFLNDKQNKSQTEEYRLGFYVARKRKKRNNSAVITLEHYLARNGVRAALESFPQATAIRYEQESLDLNSIATYKLVPLQIGKLTVVLPDNEELMWRQTDDYRKQRALHRHQEQYTQTHGQ